MAVEAQEIVKTDFLPLEAVAAECLEMEAPVSEPILYSELAAAVDVHQKPDFPEAQA